MYFNVEKFRGKTHKIETISDLLTFELLMELRRLTNVQREILGVLSTAHLENEVSEKIESGPSHVCDFAEAKGSDT